MDIPKYRHPHIHLFTSSSHSQQTHIHSYIGNGKVDHKVLVHGCLVTVGSPLNYCATPCYTSSEADSLQEIISTYGTTKNFPRARLLKICYSSDDAPTKLFYVSFFLSCSVALSLYFSSSEVLYACLVIVVRV